MKLMVCSLDKNGSKWIGIDQLKSSWYLCVDWKQKWELQLLVDVCCLMIFNLVGKSIQHNFV